MIRADQAIMGGVVLLGGWALYRLLTTKPSQTSLDAGPAGPPALPADVASLPQNILRNGEAILRPGRTYAGRIEGRSSATDVSADLRAYGLEPLAVYLSPADALAAGILPQAIGQRSSPTSAWFRATWTRPSPSGASRAALTAPGRGTVSLLWESAGVPADRASGLPFWPSQPTPLWRARF